MKTLLITARNLTLISILTLWAVAAAHGQTGIVLSANVPFGFEAGGTSFPAGAYQFKFTSGEQSFVISGAKGGETKLPIVSRLGGPSLFKDTGLVFDAFEGHHVLSELWIPGEGGVLVNASPKQHAHEMVVAMVSGAQPTMSGKEVFEHTCARCHGVWGNGNPAADKFFQTPIPRLASAAVQAKSNQELREIITQGKRNMDPVRVGQGSVQHLLDPASVDAVIKYVRTLKQP
jgi:cytochrome c553